MRTPKIFNPDKFDQAVSESTKAFLFLMPEARPDKWEDCSDMLEIVNNIRKGFQVEAVDQVLEKTSISCDQLSHILHVGVRRLMRDRKGERLSAGQSGSLYELGRVYVRGADIFGDQETFEKWLQRPQITIGNQVPLTLLDTTEGFRIVNDLLSQVEYGFYS